MRLLLTIACVAGLLTAPVCRANDFPLENRETFQRTLSAAPLLEVDNISGFIHIAGDGGNSVRVDGEKIIRARDAEAMDRAKREVTLDVTDNNGVAKLYVNGPFRTAGHGRRDYEVIYNLTIRVPRSIALGLRDVNGGIRAAGTSGHFDFSTVNGAIEAENIAGSGSVRSVNGKQNVSFNAIPRAATNFHTVNGGIDVAFPPDLSADFHVTTLNGSVYSAFQESSPPVTAGAFHRWASAGRRVTSFRIGHGGPVLTFETLNGSIRIARAR